MPEITGQVFSHDLCDHAYGYCGQTEVEGRGTSCCYCGTRATDCPTRAALCCEDCAGDREAHAASGRVPTPLPGWEIEGPKHKDADRYMSRDGDNPEAPWPGYGWPLGSECWYFVLTGHGRRLFATGLTVESAVARAEHLMATAPASGGVE